MNTTTTTTTTSRPASGTDEYRQGYRKAQELIATSKIPASEIGSAIDSNRHSRSQWQAGYVAAHLDDLHERALVEYAEPRTTATP